MNIQQIENDFSPENFTGNRYSGSESIVAKITLPVAIDIRERMDVLCGQVTRRTFLFSVRLEGREFLRSSVYGHRTHGAAVRAAKVAIRDYAKRVAAFEA